MKCGCEVLFFSIRIRMVYYMGFIIIFKNIIFLILIYGIDDFSIVEYVFFFKF